MTRTPAKRITFLAFALLLLLLLLPTLRRLRGAPSSLPVADAAEEVADDLNDGGDFFVSDADGGQATVDGRTSKQGHGAMVAARGMLSAGAGVGLEDASFQEWLALEPFRQASGQANNDGSNAAVPSGEGNGLGSLLGRSFAGLPGGAGPRGIDAGFGGGIGAGGFPGGGFHGSSEGQVSALAGSQVAESPETAKNASNGIRVSSDKLALNSGNDQNVNGPSHPSDAGSTKLNDGGSSGGDALGGKGGSESNNTSSAEAGGNSGIGGSDVGVLFAPGNETGDPDSTDVSLILTDGSGSGGPSEGGIGLSAVTPQDPAPVPEPANLFLLGSGLILGGLTFRRRRLGAATSFRSISS